MTAVHFSLVTWTYARRCLQSRMKCHTLVLGLGVVLAVQDANADMQLDPGFRARFNLENQERCEQMCLRCIDSGNDEEDCAANLFFHICCCANGGTPKGCGCRVAI